jgi:hypothetical protein
LAVAVTLLVNFPRLRCCGNPRQSAEMVEDGFLGFLTMASIAMVHVDQPQAEFLVVLLFAPQQPPSAAIILIHGNLFNNL